MLVLRSARRPDLSSMLQIEKSKTIFNQKNNCAWLGIIQIQRSFNLQVFNGKRLNRFFHVIQRILQQAAPDQRISSWSRTWWGSYCGQPNDLALTKDRTSSTFCFLFFNFFCVFFFYFVFIFYIKFLFFAVNTMSLLGIQTTICVSLNSK